MTEGGIRTEAAGPVWRITIDRPESLNALDPEAHRRLADAFDRFAARDDLLVAVITGAGERAFCVGSDLKAREAVGGDDHPATGFAGLTQRFDLLKPVVAAVNGHAIGGGLEIVLACDLAVAVGGARFGLPEPRVGLAAKGGLHRLARHLSMKQAMEVALTGWLFDAETALALGLVNRVVDRDALWPTVDSLVAEILEGAPLAIQATKQMMQEGLAAGSLEAAFTRHYDAVRRMEASADAREGSRAFIEKRSPVWKGE